MIWWALIGALAFLAGRRGEEHSHDSEDDSDATPDEKAAGAEPVPIPPPGFEPLWPMPGVSREGKPKAGGRFGVARPLRGQPKTRRHAGVDIGAPHLTSIIAPEDGAIIATQGWQGDNAKAIMFRPFRKGAPLLLFGAVAPDSWPPVMLPLIRGMELAKVGMYPHGSTMLHLEAYRRDSTKTNKRWFYGKPAPPELLDPTPYLDQMVAA